jgi:hypothetical protein
MACPPLFSRLYNVENGKFVEGWRGGTKKDRRPEFIPDGGSVHFV